MGSQNEAQTFNGGITVKNGASFENYSIGGKAIKPELTADQILENVVEFHHAVAGVVATQTIQILVVSAASILKTLKATLGTQCSSGHSVVIDVQRYSSGSWATILTGTNSFTNADASESVKSLTLATVGGQPLNAGDKLKLIKTVTGSSGADLVISGTMFRLSV